MAGSAGHVGVPVGQQEARRAVIEDRRGPRNRVVASVAVGHSKSSPCRGVHRIIRLLPSRQVAARIPAVRRPYHQAVIVVEVAGGTGHIGMAIRQREPGGAVVELRAQPAVKRVAGVAGGRELCADVIRIRSLGSPASGRKRRPSTGPGIGPLQRPCGSPRIAPRRARRTAENDSGDPLPAERQYSSPARCGTARNSSPSSAGECPRGTLHNSCPHL